MLGTTLGKISGKNKPAQTTTEGEDETTPSVESKSEEVSVV